MNRDSLVKPQPACPACGDQTCGYTYDSHETNRRIGNWGEGSESAGTGWVVSQSLVKCIGCGHTFNHDSLLRKGLL